MNIDQYALKPRRLEDGDRRRRLAEVFSALGDPTRVGILEAVSLQDLSPDALAAELGVSGNLLAHHLKVLQQAGLITRSHSQHDRRRSYVQSSVEEFPWLANVLGDRLDLQAPRVLFVCTHNSARSVLAEALWRRVSAVPSASAGTAPSASINPRARRVARALGLPLRSSRPRHVQEVLRSGDVVVSVCDAVNEELPPMPNRRLHWSIADPSATDTDRDFRRAADQLRHRVERLASRITPTPDDHQTKGENR